MLQMDIENRPNSPERSLLVAVLERAVFDYFGNQLVDREEARGWLFAESDPCDSFTFRWVCSQLDINPDEFLRRVVGLKPRNNMSTQQWWGSLTSLQQDENSPQAMYA